MPIRPLIVIAALAVVMAGPLSTRPVAAQERNPLKDIFDKAERERDKKAVDDLIKRLERPGSTPPAATPPPPTPPPVAVPSPPAAPSPTQPPLAATPSPPISPTPRPDAPVVLPPLGPPGSPPIAAPAPPVAPPLPPTPPPIAERPPSPPSLPPAGPQPVAPPPVAAPIERAPEMARRQELPSVDLEVFFEFNRSEITPQGAEALKLLGQALADPRLAGARFIIAGHTDGRGTVAYNLALSQARAESVRRWIIENYRVPPQNLIARGFGKSQLKDAANPLADQNRRVQIINWTGQAMAVQPRPRR